MPEEASKKEAYKRLTQHAVQQVYEILEEVSYNIP
jgi:hypothetical protein